MANRLWSSVKATGLDKILGPLAVGTVALEGAKYAVINPALERAGIKTPSYVPPPAMSSYEEMMLGRQEKLGFFNSRSPVFGYQSPTQGLIEKRALAKMDMEQRAQEQAYELARMRVQRQPDALQMQQLLNQRDNFAAVQNTLGNVSANMASTGGGMGTNTTIGYSMTPTVPLPQQQAYVNGNMGFYGAQRGSGRGRGRGRGRSNPYGVDTGMDAIPGLPVTQEMREEMFVSPEQMGQFSGRGGRIARGYDSQKFGQMDNSVPYGTDSYVMGMEQQPVQSMGRRRRGRG